MESLATQTLVIFVIRTRRVPFFRSVASAPMALAAVGIVALGAMLPYTGHLARVLGFRPLPGTFFFALGGVVVVYLVLVEFGKYWFYRLYHAPATPALRHRTPGHRVRRRAARFTTRHHVPARPARRADRGGAGTRAAATAVGAGPEAAAGPRGTGRDAARRSGRAARRAGW